MKARPLIKGELDLLIELISKHKVVTSKSTNATYNKLKEEAWISISENFGAMTGTKRRPDQLRLKWENLKKAARKRLALIQQNSHKTDAGKFYVPPNEILDRVTSIISTTCVHLDKSGDTETDTGQANSDAVMELLDLKPLPDQLDQNYRDGILGDYADDSSASSDESEDIKPIPKRKLIAQSDRNKQIKLSGDVLRAQRDKDLAIAAYFRAKTAKVKLENIKLKLELKQLKAKNNEQ